VIDIAFPFGYVVGKGTLKVDGGSERRRRRVLTTKAEGEKGREITTVEGLRNKDWKEDSREQLKMDDKMRPSN
jgi:hypothetical protein